MDKSVITCDMEGRIETFNEGAAHLFGYSAEEVIGKKRVSLFSPGLVVLEHVPRWLATASTTGEFTGKTVFVRKDGAEFPAEIRITPTMKGGKQIGFCGVSVALPAAELSAVRPRVSTGTRVFAGLVITRAPFLTATLLPVLIAAALVGRASASPFPWAAFALALVGALALHVAANVLNDYFDWTSGTDQDNNDYFLPFSGGSRAIELGLVTPSALLAIGTIALLTASACGLLLLRSVGPGILGFGAIGAFAAVFYTAPPIRLAARKGLGELFVGLCFGPLMVAGSSYALVGQVVPGALPAGIAMGLLTAAILWINEFPDAASDARSGKHHLVVVLGKRTARLGYLALLVGAAIALVVGVFAQQLPKTALLGLLALPLGLRSTRVLFAHYEDRALVTANRDTIMLHAAVGALLALGIVASRWFA